MRIVATLWFLISFSHCLAMPRFDGHGRAIYRPSHVTAQYMTEWLRLASDARELLGYDMLAIADLPDGDGSIVVNKEAVEENGKQVAAFTLNRDITLLPPNEISEGLRQIVLAHEIGHAMGLQHEAAGLMSEFAHEDCAGQEAACLIEALKRQDRF